MESHDEPTSRFDIEELKAILKMRVGSFGGHICIIGADQAVTGFPSIEETTGQEGIIDSKMLEIALRNPEANRFYLESHGYNIDENLK